MIEITVSEVKAKLDAGEPLHLLDVREHQELEVCSLPGAEHIPMMTLFTGIRNTTASPDDEIVVFCHVGVRSFEAANYLRMQGYKHAKSMAGGVEAWAREIDPSMPRY